MTLAIDITDGCGLSNEVRHEYLPEKSCISHSFHSKMCLTSCTLLIRRSVSVLKVCRKCGIEAFKRRVVYRVMYSNNFSLKQLSNNFMLLVLYSSALALNVAMYYTLLCSP